MTAVLVGVAVLALVLVTAFRARVDFKERFPLISDAEFLARCSPGTNPEMAIKVRRIVARHFAVEYERVHPTMTFVDDLGAD
jgi:hypothetical protein